MLYHWCPRADWPPPGSAYRPAAYAEDGFVHCSFVDQITATAGALDRGRDDLVLLAVADEELPVVVEDCYEVGEPYPHVYGPLPVSSVTAVVDFPCLPDGSFALPPDLPLEDVAPPAAAAAALAGAAHPSLPVVGRMLARLAGASPGHTVLEIGTGAGHGAAWIASGLRPDQRLVTVEADPDRAATACSVLSDVARVEVLTGDWQGALDAGPFGLIFVDAGPAKDRAELLAPALVPGGVAVLDDLTARHTLGAEFLAADPWRRAWLGHPLLDAAERQVSQAQSVLVARRR